MKNNKKCFFVLISIIIMISGSFCNALAYPDKNITSIIGWGAGSGSDAANRGIMHYAEKQLNVSILTENITGASSGIATLKVMNARPDGYTIGTLTYDGVITVPYFDLVPGYDLERLTYLCFLTNHVTVLAVHGDSPWNTVEDFLEEAKARPGELTVSNPGVGGVNHLPMLDLSMKAGVEFNHICYAEGANRQREALLSKETDAACIAIVTAIPNLASGEIRILGVMSDERSEFLPEVPTFKESGYDLIWGSFRVAAVPKDVPEEIKDFLEETFRKVYKDEEFIEWSTKTALGAYWRNREDTAKYVQNAQEQAFSLMDDLVEKGILTK